jgi:hypothetical protein
MTGMEAINPTPVISNVQYHAQGVSARGRGKQEEDVQAMRPEPAERELIRYNAVGKDANGALVSDGKVAGYNVDSDEAQQIVRHVNTKTDLEINRWSEIAGYLRWGTLGLMTLAFGAFTAVLVGNTPNIIGALSTQGLQSVAAMIASPALPIFLGFTALAAVTAGIGLYMTNHVRKLQSERWMDVQGFLQERSAVKVGQEVARAIATEPDAPAQETHWQDRVENTPAPLIGRI